MIGHEDHHPPLAGPTPTWVKWVTGLSFAFVFGLIMAAGRLW